MRNFVPALIVMFVVAAFLRADFYFAILYLLFALFLLSRAWSRRVTHAVAVERRSAERAFMGDRVPVSLEIHNRSRLPVPWIEINETLPVELSTPPFHREVFSLSSRERRRTGYTLTCRRRGYYELGPLVVQSGDLLGIVSPTRVQIPPGHLIVYPRVVPLQQLGLPSHSPFVTLPAGTTLFEDPNRVRGVRPYRRSDSPRRIHWPATARTGELVVKQFQPAIARETFLCLDLDEASYERGQRYTATELAIVAAASLANHIVTREKLPAGLATEAFDPLAGEVVPFSLPSRAEQGHLQLIMEQLARVRVARTGGIRELLRRERPRLAWGTTVVIITGGAGEGLLDALLQMKHAGFVVMLLLIQPRRLAEGLRERTQALGIPVYRIWDEQTLEIEP